jgi:polyhydroxyalkanoate synthase
MKDKPATGTTPVPATRMNVQNAITGLRGRDLISTLRMSAATACATLAQRKALAGAGRQLGRVLLGDTLHPTPARQPLRDPAWSQNPFYRRSLQAYLAWQKQTRLWIDESN